MTDNWNIRAERLEATGLYRAADEHDACGVGLVASIDGKPRRSVVKSAINALKAVWHRGAVDADGKTGDGAGIHLQIPEKFFRDHITALGWLESAKDPFAVGMIFLPRTDYDAQETCRVMVETEIIRFGYSIYGWRQVPVDPGVIGEKAQASRPEIAQIIIQGKPDRATEDFERDLYIIRKRIERKAQDESINEFYICSLSCRSIVYKGLFRAEQLADFYPDLQDDRIRSAYAIFHQRFSTNTAPVWRLAQPFRLIAHNGEINTVRGNSNWMKSHEASMSSPLFGDHVKDLIPIVPPNSSDTGVLDAAMELFVRAGRSMPEVKTLLIPPAWSQSKTLPEAHRAFFNYCNCVIAPWDGPAAIAATDGRWIMAGMDRNGLRPMRYSITDDGLLTVGSEAGMVPVKRAEIIEKGRLGPGQMIAVDMQEGKLYHDLEIKDKLAAKHPYAEWVKHIKTLADLKIPKPARTPGMTAEALCRSQLASGLTHEDMETLLAPMVLEGKEGIGSMGDDTPLAVLSKHYRGMHHFFRQNFSQVTNPPIDSLRERSVMSLNTRIGNKENILTEGPQQTSLFLLKTPVLLSHEFEALKAHLGKTVAILDATFDPKGGKHALREGLRALTEAADRAIKEGKSDFVITDEGMGRERCGIPMVLAVGAVHTHLVKRAVRKQNTLLVRSAECLDVHHIAVLIGVGATTVNAYLAEAAIVQRHADGLYAGLSLEHCLETFKEAISNGLLKIMSKMGISVISAYRGGKNFEAIGLSRSLVAEFFPGLTSRISGIGIDGLQKRKLALHEKAWATPEAEPLPQLGLYKYRARGETHAFDGKLIHQLQGAVASGRYKAYKEYSNAVAALPPVNLRDLMATKPLRRRIPVEEVESVTEIRKRFVAPAMSLGALSPEAHEVLAIAMNRIGAGSNSGEGGEGPERFHPRANGDNANSVIKQVASGRFGVTAEYLNNCREIQIKIAQGAKPGEGGQLPGFKVTMEIARLRHATHGVMLISTPPHHDIYSIEDLAQLIYDLKQINPEALVSVKLVSQAGIGTIASGVAKAMADKILISGHSGGTGASPYSSIRYAGAPGEMGLAEVNQVLTLNRLRHRVVLQTDGGFKTGRDVVIAAMLGAEEYGFGTLSLVAMGCIMVRQCHSNTCPVGVCTQDEKLREKFEGSVERVVNLFTFIAEEVREILADLGVRSLNEIIGRADLLQQVGGGRDVDTLDLGPLLTLPDQGDYPRYCTLKGRNEVPDTLDTRMLKDAESALKRGEKIQLAYTVENTCRTIGTRLSSVIGRLFDPKTLQSDHITVRLRGSAGQSLGAFMVNGIRLEVYGDANDYVGKGLSGGTIIVRPRPSSPLVTSENTIIGNTALYGATSGTLFAAGQAGERFAVRNSGAVAVVEGCGSNGCEYMTGGTVAILGNVGDNFAAGMTGGMAFIYDPKEDFQHRVNPESVVTQRMESDYWENELRTLIEAYFKATESPHAEAILLRWETTRDYFWQVCPKEMVTRLEQPLSDGLSTGKRQASVV
ncbi:MAG: glutamate synthase large subunit [Alphaproteobacteria bacterium]|nr:glutamate synthase large subunit [Alphaproteobacteria bacterium]